MRIAVLSGKGGTGKTFVSVNLAAAAINSTYIDCDVEEPDGRIFIKPKQTCSKEVYKLLPVFDSQKCTGCRKCVDFCNFNALAFIKNKPIVFDDICHSCGGCFLLCPEKAISEKKKVVGYIESGKYKSINIITGILNEGEPSAIPVIKAALNTGNGTNETVIIDCPPGSGCSVMESLKSADCCLLVIEPTVFGLHNFKMVYNLCNLINKPTFAIINKEIEQYPQIEKYCSENNIPVLLHIPYDKETAKALSSGNIISEINKKYELTFKNLLCNINTRSRK